MSDLNIDVIETDIETIVAISNNIPELKNPHGIEEYRKRLTGKDPLILAAFSGDKPAGFKVGYNKFNDGSFYSWMGGVIPEFRNQHIAKKLSEYQEKWAKTRGYKTVRFKTRNRHKAMLTFGLTNGFYIVGFEQKETVEEHRIILEKVLGNL